MLEDKPAPIDDTYILPTGESVEELIYRLADAESFGERISRLIGTSRYVQHYAGLIKELTAAGDNRHAVVEDLCRLESELEAADQRIRDAADKIREFRAAFGTWRPSR
jgi:hypothetical protein